VGHGTVIKEGTFQVNDDRLQIYVNDHLALLLGETELAARCHRSNQGGTLGIFLRQLTTDLQVEQSDLRTILHQLNAAESLIKQGLAWLAEKAGRFKLNDALLRYSDLSRLVELETLAVAALEREAFWENLQVTRAADTRLSEIDFKQRQQQARRHGEILRQHRLEAARKAI
jgi:hypothetical protein